MARSMPASVSYACSDCSAPNAEWASVNKGTALCDECCSVHRSFGRHISQIKSFHHSFWPPNLLAMFRSLMAADCNRNIWEYSLSSDHQSSKNKIKKPSVTSPLRPNKDDFIKAKYIDFAFKVKLKDEGSEKELNRQLVNHLHSKNPDIDTTLKLISSGANPDYFYLSRGNNSLHVAAKSGLALQVELICCLGANPSHLDANGITPSEYAGQAGHLVLAERLVQLEYELTDKLAFYVCGRWPNHHKDEHFIIPQVGPSEDKLAIKAARGKLHVLDNRLFESICMDVYDELDRREVEAIWHKTQALNCDTIKKDIVAHLPINPDLSTTRNQGRQKLARFSNKDFAVLIIDLLTDGERRASGRKPEDIVVPDAVGVRKSDSEPLYDEVASDDEKLNQDPDYDVPNSNSLYSEVTDAANAIYCELNKDRWKDPPKFILSDTSPELDGLSPSNSSDFDPAAARPMMPLPAFEDSACQTDHCFGHVDRRSSSVVPPFAPSEKAVSGPEHQLVQLKYEESLKKLEEVDLAFLQLKKENMLMQNVVQKVMEENAGLRIQLGLVSDQSAAPHAAQRSRPYSMLDKFTPLVHADQQPKLETIPDNSPVSDGFSPTRTGRARCHDTPWPAASALSNSLSDHSLCNSPNVWTGVPALGRKYSDGNWMMSNGTALSNGGRLNEESPLLAIDAQVAAPYTMVAPGNDQMFHTLPRISNRNSYQERPVAAVSPAVFQGVDGPLVRKEPDDYDLPWSSLDKKKFLRETLAITRTPVTQVDSTAVSANVVQRSYTFTSGQQASPRIPVKQQAPQSQTSNDESPCSEEVMKKTEKITKHIQDLFQAAKANVVDKFIPCSMRIGSAVQDMVRLFPERPKSEAIRNALTLMKTSSQRLQDDCKKTVIGEDVDYAFISQQVIQYAFDIAQAARQLVLLYPSSSAMS